jgi:ATP/maltotriose-dependent transcriptional regulator MalT
LQGKYELAAVRLEEAMRLTDLIPDERVREQSLAFTRMLVARLDVDRGHSERAQSNCALAWGVLSGTWAEGEIERTAAMVARAQGDLDRAAGHLDRAGAAVERGEDIDRGVTFLEQMYLCLDRGDGDQAREWAKRIVEISRRLQNDELMRRARMGLGA